MRYSRHRASSSRKTKKKYTNKRWKNSKSNWKELYKVRRIVAQKAGWYQARKIQLKDVGPGKTIQIVLPTPYRRRRYRRYKNWNAQPQVPLAQAMGLAQPALPVADQRMQDVADEKAEIPDALAVQVPPRQENLDDLQRELRAQDRERYNQVRWERMQLKQRIAQLEQRRGPLIPRRRAQDDISV